MRMLAIAQRVRAIPLVVSLLIVPTRFLPSSIASSVATQDYDVVILHGRVIDPESKLDAIRNIGINQGTIQAITDDQIIGRITIDAKGLIVSPGFIDLHVHDMDEQNHRFEAMDGVTTAMELEVGTADVDRWYAERDGKRLINYGVSIGHIKVRMSLMHDPSKALLPSGDATRRVASEAEIEKMKRHIEHGLKRGAVAVGFGIAYTAAASHWEILEMFRAAASFGAPCFVHLRHLGDKEPNSIQALEEVIAAAMISGAPLHAVHIQSTGGRATPRLLQMISEAQSHGLDVTTECYPYTAGMTAIESATFNEG